MNSKLYIRDGRIKLSLFILVLLASLVFVYGKSSATPMEMIPSGAFLFSSVLLGIGLGVDVVCYTVGRFRQVQTWSERAMGVFRVSVTHTVFPLSGLTLCLVLGSLFEVVNWIVALCGALLLIMIVHELHESATAGEAEQGSSDSAPRPRFRLREWGLVIGVSLDALLFGPTQLEQINAKAEHQIVASFLVVGIVVAILGILAAWMSARLHRLAARSDGTTAGAFAKIQLVGAFVEAAVVGFFGVRAVLAGSGFGEIPSYAVALGSVGLTTLVFVFLGRKLYRNFMKQGG